VVGQRPWEPKISSEPRTIVLVEDEFLIRIALADDLTEAGFVVLQAYNASQGLEVLQNSMRVEQLLNETAPACVP
jgi:two-component system, response regulator PdtaR